MSENSDQVDAEEVIRENQNQARNSSEVQQVSDPCSNLDSNPVSILLSLHGTSIHNSLLSSTNSAQDPTDINKSSRVKKRQSSSNFTPYQLARLEEVFMNNPFPKPENRKAVSTELGVADHVLKYWFQNRRAAAKRELKAVKDGKSFQTIPKRKKNSFVFGDAYSVSDVRQ